jgi:hypothetical protein
LKAEYIRGDLQPGDDAAEARWVTPQQINNLEVSATTIKLLKNSFGFGL